MDRAQRRGAGSAVFGAPRYDNSLRQRRPEGFTSNFGRRRPEVDHAERPFALQGRDNLEALLVEYLHQQDLIRSYQRSLAENARAEQETHGDRAMTQLISSFEDWVRETSAPAKILRQDCGPPATLTLEFHGLQLDVFAEEVMEDGKAQLFISEHEPDADDEYSSDPDDDCGGNRRAGFDADAWLADVNTYLADHPLTLDGALKLMTRTLPQRARSSRPSSPPREADDDEHEAENFDWGEDALNSVADLHLLHWCQSRRLPRRGLAPLRARFAKKVDDQIGMSPVWKELSQAATCLQQDHEQRACPSSAYCDPSLGLVHLGADPLNGLGVNRALASQLGIDVSRPLVAVLALSDAALEPTGWQRNFMDGGPGSMRAVHQAVVASNFLSVVFCQPVISCATDASAVPVTSELSSFAVCELLPVLFADLLAAYVGVEPIAAWVQDLRCSCGLTGNLILDFWRTAIPFFMVNATGYCPMCLSRHGGMMPAAKLCPCQEELCVFRYEEFMTPILAELRNDPAIAELHVMFASVAADGTAETLEPFPPHFLRRREVRHRSGIFGELDDGAASKLGRHTFGSRKAEVAAKMALDKNKDAAGVRDAIAKLPQLSTLGIPDTEHSLREQLIKTASPEAYRLLHFVLGTSRFLLKQAVSEAHALPGLPPGAKQLAVVGGSASERRFLERKGHHYSSFGFHGSPLGKWYSIMRNGLRVMSDTSFMTTGAAFGTGIYLARHLDTAMHYCGGARGASYPCSFGKTLQVVAVVEYIMDETCCRHHAQGIVTVADPSAVMLRYLLVYGTAGNARTPALQRFDIGTLDVASRHAALQQEVLREAWSTTGSPDDTSSTAVDLSFLRQDS